jgi:hypothetical protein
VGQELNPGLPEFVTGMLTVPGSAFWREPSGIIYVYFTKRPVIKNASQIYAIERYNLVVKYFVIQRINALQGFTYREPKISLDQPPRNVLSHACPLLAVESLLAVLAYLDIAACSAWLVILEISINTVCSVVKYSVAK